MSQYYEHQGRLPLDIDELVDEGLLPRKSVAWGCPFEVNGAVSVLNASYRINREVAEEPDAFPASYEECPDLLLHRSGPHDNRYGHKLLHRESYLLLEKARSKKDTDRASGNVSD